jgi:hypothetical protein
MSAFGVLPKSGATKLAKPIPRAKANRATMASANDPYRMACVTSEDSTVSRRAQTTVLPSHLLSEYRRVKIRGQTCVSSQTWRV